MQPNGVIHSHEVKLLTISPTDGDICETYGVPDKIFHDLRAYLKKFRIGGKK